MVGVGTEESFVSRVESKRAFETRTPGSASTWSPYSSESSLFSLTFKVGFFFSSARVFYFYSFVAVICVNMYI